MVVTITRGGYAKRTRSDNYRAQRRGGKGVRGAQLREDDLVDHFFVTTTHHWLLFFTNLGRVYRAKAYELPEGGRDAKGQHVANLLAFQPGEKIAQVLDIRDYDQAEYLVLATQRGLVKKTRLTEYDSNRSGGVIAINLREDEDGLPDELVSARLVDSDQDLILVSRKGQSVRFTASDEALRPMGRATSGVTGMKFRGGRRAARDGRRARGRVPVHRDRGRHRQAHRADGRELPPAGPRRPGHQGRQPARGQRRPGRAPSWWTPTTRCSSSWSAARSCARPPSEVNATGRTTQGVIFAKPDNGDRIIAVARNTERHLADEPGTVGAENGQVSDGPDAVEAVPTPRRPPTEAVTDQSAEDA